MASTDFPALSVYNSVVKSTVRVAAPPDKPVMIYDGDCRFCELWIRRWQSATGDRIEYIPFQDPRVATQFPEIAREQFEAAVQLIQPDGAVYAGAEAVFRSLAANRCGRWWLKGYASSKLFAGAADGSYRFVARHRTFFSFLTRLLWGKHLAPQSHQLVRSIFLRSLGIVYLIAFVSLWTQIVGLIGHNGITPVQDLLKSVEQYVSAEHHEVERYHLLPTLCWFGASDGSLKWQCAAGTALAILLVIGVAPAPCLFLLWLIYLSLTSAGNVFLGFQWDALLLETGFLAIFFAPLRLLPRRPSRESPPSRIVLWLLRWLLFRLMFESGVVKLTWGDATWIKLNALNLHYETQPLPTWIGWYAHQLPQWFQKSSTVVMFAIELAVPFLIFAPRRPRQLAAVVFVVFQLVILLTGNYCFFNLLTIALCLTLLDDAGMQACSRWLGDLWRRIISRLPRDQTPDEPAAPQSAPSPPRRSAWGLAVTLPLLALVLGTSYVQLFDSFIGGMPGEKRARLSERWLGPMLSLEEWLAPFRSFNGYGLFRVMTTTRREIVIEGSDDGVNWKAYEFRYKPGDVTRRPGFVEPHQPRLDWQMWFAALGDYRQNPWFINLCARLLQGSPEVLSLLKQNPFPDAPPRAVRAMIYEYHFTDPATRRRTGEWWHRELKGIYLPSISLSPRPNPTDSTPVHSD
jgi:predicted DCC family thiol-disulfide oxidoreductase YuxK